MYATTTIWNYPVKKNSLYHTARILLLIDPVPIVETNPQHCSDEQMLFFISGCLDITPETVHTDLCEWYGLDVDFEGCWYGRECIYKVPAMLRHELRNAYDWCVKEYGYAH